MDDGDKIARRKLLRWAGLVGAGTLVVGGTWVARQTERYQDVEPGNAAFFKLTAEERKPFWDAIRSGRDWSQRPSFDEGQSLAIMNSLTRMGFFGEKNKQRQFASKEDFQSFCSEHNIGNKNFKDGLEAFGISISGKHRKPFVDLMEKEAKPTYDEYKKELPDFDRVNVRVIGKGRKVITDCVREGIEEAVNVLRNKAPWPWQFTTDQRDLNPGVEATR